MVFWNKVLDKYNLNKQLCDKGEWRKLHKEKFHDLCY